MLDAAQNFTSEYNVTFNESKTKYVVFNEIDRELHIRFNGSVIECNNTQVHLGNIVGLESNCKNIRKSINSINTKVSELVALFSHVNSDIKYYLFKTYCMPLYGCQIWNIDNLDIDGF